MTSLYMFPPLFKSRGLKSPSFLEWSKKKRKKRQALKKLLKRKRKKLLKKAFNNLYYFEKKFQTKQWLLIEERFIEATGKAPPPAIIYWFLDH